jgi:hypothetical protein
VNEDEHQGAEDSEDAEAPLPTPTELGDLAVKTPDSDTYLSAAIARAIDSAYSDAKRWWDVGDLLRALLADAGFDADSALVRDPIFAVSYVLRLSHGEAKAGCRLVPATESADASWPPRISEVTDNTIELWRHIADHVTHPAARARFRDLLFERGDGNRRDHALAAASAYLEDAASRERLDLDVTADLVRAWGLARTMSDTSREQQSVDAMLIRVSSGLNDSPAAPPGCVFPLLAALVAPSSRASTKTQTQPNPVSVQASINDLLNQAWSVYRGSLHTAQVAELMRVHARGDRAAITAIDRREVEAYLAEAQATSGMIKQVALERAIAISRDRGLKELRAQATAELQAIPVTSLGLKPISSPINIHPEQIERSLAAFTASPDWQDGIGVFLATGPPTGDLSTIKAQAVELAEVAVFRSLIPTVRLNADGLPVATTSSPEEREAALLADCAGFHAQFSGQALTQGLYRMKAEYGIPPESDLLVVLSGNGRWDQGLAASVAKAFLHFWNDDYESCIAVALPKIETAVRALLLELGEPIFRTQLGSNPGDYSSLHELLRKLEDLALDESWAYFLRWLLISPHGPNLRNDFAHGLVKNFSPVNAALVLKAATMLSTIVPPQLDGKDPTSTSDRDELLSRLAEPTPETELGANLAGRADPFLGRRWFVSASSRIDLRPLLAVLKSRGVDAYVLSDIAEPGTPVVRKSQIAVVSADAVVAVLEPGTAAQEAMLDAGAALGRGKPALIIADPTDTTPLERPGAIIIRTKPDDVTALNRALDQITGRQLRSDVPAAQREKPIGPLAGRLLGRLAKAQPGSGMLAVELLTEAIEASGATAASGVTQGDKQYDIGIWSDDLAELGLNPLVVELKGSLSPAAVEQALLHLRTNPTLRSALLVSISEDTTIAGSEPVPFQVLAITLPELLRQMRTASFAEVVRRLRNRAVHGLSAQ